MKMCKRCINTTNNPSITIDEEGICNVCRDYETKFDEKKLDEFVKFLESKLNRNKLSDLDIVSDEYFERITYDKDTLENLKNNKK